MNAGHNILVIVRFLSVGGALPHGQPVRLYEGMGLTIDIPPPLLQQEWNQTNSQPFSSPSHRHMARRTR